MKEGKQNNFKEENLGRDIREGEMAKRKRCPTGTRKSKSGKCKKKSKPKAKKIKIKWW